MKANHSGTFAEQTRARANWKPPGEIERGQVERCGNCRHMQLTDRLAIHCTLLTYATLGRAWCGNWEVSGAFRQKGSR